jgi:hypothetical protein
MSCIHVSIEWDSHKTQGSVENAVVKLWNPISRSSYVVCDLLRHPSPSPYPFRIGSICAHDSILLVGGFFGEVCSLRLDTDQEPNIFLMSHSTDAITNHISIPDSGDGRIAFLSNNDASCKILDIELMKTRHTYQQNWAVNVCP